MLSSSPFSAALLGFATAIPRSPLSATFATLTSSTGSDSNLSFSILCTMSVSFSNTNMSSGPKKSAILVVLFKPVSTIRSSFRSGSLNVGPPIAARALVLWTTGLSGWLFTLPSVAGERLVVVVVIGDLLVLSGVIE